MSNELMNKLLKENKAINNSVLKEALDGEEIANLLRHTFEKAAREAMLVRPRRKLFVDFMTERYNRIESCTPELIEHWLDAFLENKEFESADAKSKGILLKLSPEVYSSKAIEEDEVGEGKVPADQDTESTKIKKLTEQDDEEMPAEDVPSPPAALDDEPAEVSPAEEPMEEPEEELEMELVGSKGDTYFYMTTQDSDAGEREDLIIVDQDEDKVFSAKEAELDINDEGRFLLEALREIDIDSVSYDLVVKYIFPMIEEAKEEEEEEGEGEGEEEVAGEELPLEDEEKEIPVESKENRKISTTFERDGKTHKCSLEVKESNAAVTLTVDGKTFTFSADLGGMYKEGETYTEEDLETMATDVIDNLPPEDEMSSVEDEEIPDEELSTVEETPEEEEEEEEEKDKRKVEGKTKRGKRDGTGPYKDSAQRSISKIGKRKQRGEKCPAEDKKK